jgi:hypothetical protein
MPSGENPLEQSPLKSMILLKKRGNTDTTNVSGDITVSIRVVKSASATDSAASQCSAFQCQCRVSGMIWHWIGTGFMKNRVLKLKSYILINSNFCWSEN